MSEVRKLNSSVPSALGYSRGWKVRADEKSVLTFTSGSLETSCVLSTWKEAASSDTAKASARTTLEADLVA